jgi:predicted nuclease of restriction endonuclease-like (RecB) superfamily
MMELTVDGEDMMERTGGENVKKGAVTEREIAMAGTGTEKGAEEELVGYAEILNDIKSILEKAKYQAYKAVDNIRVQTYWQVGERIVRGELRHNERADYGERLIENLARDLMFDRRLFYRVVGFYRIYPIVVTVSPQLSWSHYEVLISVDGKEIRQFYEQQAIQNTWSVRELRKQIKSNLYARVEKGEGKGEIIIAPATTAKPVLPEEVFKDTYHFDFLNLSEGYTEEELKTALLNKLEKFLQELGNDFFIGRREVPILMGNQYYRIDLEMFHASLLCYILVEIKTEAFKPSFVGQMNAYLNWYRENRWYDGQRQPVGLIVCKTRDVETVHYALGDLKLDIFVAEYKLKLPSEAEIKKALVR